MKKKIILKVSDFRSARLQSKILAKLGIWVSEFRIESGLNCGGHAFATKGQLLGPILEEFKTCRDELTEMLHGFYTKALAKKGYDGDIPMHETGITVQGGICTSEENNFLLKYFKLNATGWGTPFLLVPEVTNVDKEHLRKLVEAEERDVSLSQSSPLGIPFWTLLTSSSETARKEKIADGNPGSSCPKGYLAFNTDFTENAVCIASRVYQKHKLDELSGKNLSAADYLFEKNLITDKACICQDLAGGAVLKNNIVKKANTSICCGPNIVNFSRVTTLDKMIDHIYGRFSLINNPDLKHMFIKELSLYIEYLKSEIEKSSAELVDCTSRYIEEFKNNLYDGILYYKELAGKFSQTQRSRFLTDLEELKLEIENFFAGINAKVVTQ